MLITLPSQKQFVKITGKSQQRKKPNYEKSGFQYVIRELIRVKRLKAKVFH